MWADFIILDISPGGIRGFSYIETTTVAGDVREGADTRIRWLGEITVSRIFKLYDTIV